MFPRLVKDLLISLIYVYSFFIFFSGWLFNIKFTQTIKILCNWSLNGMVHVPNDLLSATSQNLENYWNKKGNACFCYRYFSETIRNKDLNFFQCFKLTKRLVQYIYTSRTLSNYWPLMYLNVNKNTSNFFCVLETSKPLGLERILLPNEMT